MMHWVDQRRVEQYLADDSVARLLDSCSTEGDEALVCQKWLRDSAAKRFVYASLYGDLLSGAARGSVLDVGGGLTALSRRLAAQPGYCLLDLLAHDPESTGRAMCAEAGRNFVAISDWYSAPVSSWDLVVANDLFPNVDQRLEPFLDRYLPRAGSIRLSLTYYDVPRFYVTRRIDADEVLCMLAWNGGQVSQVLSKHRDRIDQADFGGFTSPPPSVYPNGRQVCIVELRGDG